MTHCICYYDNALRRPVKRLDVVERTPPAVCHHRSLTTSQSDQHPCPCLFFSATPELTSAPPTSQQDQAANEAQASASVNLDPSQPITNIQIRLADGGRLVQKFNHTHR